jgi:hypothetical protein
MPNGKLKKHTTAEWFGWCEICHPNETDYNAHWQGKNAGMVAKRHAQLYGHPTRALQELSVAWEPSSV